MSGDGSNDGGGGGDDGSGGGNDSVRHKISFLNLFRLYCFI